MPTGDYSHDGVVDAADYSVWRDLLGSTTHLAADGNGNGIIDAGDYTVWASHFGPTAGSGSITKGSVPEPATLVLLLVGMLAFVVSPKPALAIQPSQPVHRDDVPGHRAGNDRVAGSLVDREVRIDASAYASVLLGVVETVSDARSAQGGVGTRTYIRIKNTLESL